METHASVSVVAPAYNEAENLSRLVPETIDSLHACENVAAFEILIVDDGSTDGTRETLDHLASLFAEVRPIVLSRNFGQSAALAAGIDAARGEVIVTIDADGQNDPADIPRLLDVLEEGFDCVSGRRADRNDSLAKTLPSWIQTQMTNRINGDVTDYGCTLKAYRADALKELDLWGESHRYIPAKLHRRGYRLTEIDVNHRQREHGSTKYGAGRLLRGFSDLLFYLFWTRWGTRPMHFFGPLGLTLLALGTLIGGHLAYTRVVLGVDVGMHVPRLFFISLLILCGLLITIWGVLSEILVRIYYADEQPYRVETVLGEPVPGLARHEEGGDEHARRAEYPRQ